MPSGTGKRFPQERHRLLIGTNHYNSLQCSYTSTFTPAWLHVGAYQPGVRNSLIYILLTQATWRNRSKALNINALQLYTSDPDNFRAPEVADNGTRR
jgi:hypothetical protein